MIIVIVDSNILFRALIAKSSIGLLFFHKEIQFYAPLRLKEEFFKNKLEIMDKSSLSEEEFSEFAALLFSRIELVPLEKYMHFIPKARELLGSHQKDEDFIALCLHLGAKLWTDEKLLWEIGFGTSVKRILQQVKNDKENSNHEQI